MAENVLDNEVVKLDFQGKKFEKNIEKSQKKLEEFSEKLNFKETSEQMKMFFANMTGQMADMTRNVARLTSELTGVGRLGSFVAQEFKGAWQGAIRSVEHLFSSLTTEQARAGYGKYDSLLRSVQTIKNATGETEETVYKVMNDLNTYTDETSYNFADMAQNISKFTTVGIGLEDAERQMEGIANWAAFAGQGATEASRAMYNISQAMSVGSMRLQDWKSIQNASMDTRKFREEAIKAGVAVGTLVQKGDQFFTKKGNKEVTLDNFTETLSTNWFDKDTMAKVFEVFADKSEGIGKEAYKAAQRCVTFKDALDAIKDMLSTGWMKTYEHIFGQLSDAIGLFSGICNKASEALSKLVDTRNGILERWSSSGGRESLWGAIVGEVEAPDGGTLFKGAFGLLDMITMIGDLFDDAMRGLIKKLINFGNTKLYENDDEYVYSYMSAGLINLTESIKDFVTNFKAFFDEIPEGAVKSRFGMISDAIQGILAVITVVSNFFEAAVSGVVKLLAQFKPAVDDILTFLSYIGQLISVDVAKAVGRNTIVDWFGDLATSLNPLATLINTIVRVLVSALGYLANVLHNAGIIEFLGDAILSISVLLNKGLAEIENSGFMKVVGEKLKEFFSLLPKGKSGLKSFGTTIKNFVSSFKGFDAVGAFFTQLIDSIKGFFTERQKLVDSVFGDSTDNAEVTNAVVEAVAPKNAAPSIIDRVRDWFTNTFGWISDVVKNVVNSEFVNKIRTFLSFDWLNIFERITPLVRALAMFKMGSGIGKIGKGVGKFGKGLGKAGKSLGEGIKEFAKAFKDKSFSELFSIKITDAFKASDSHDEASNWGVQILALAGAIAVLVYSMERLTAVIKKDPQTLLTAAEYIGGLAIGLAVVGIVTKKFAGNGQDMLMLAGSIFVLMEVIKKLGLIDLGKFDQESKWFTKGSFLDGFLKLAGMLVLIGLTFRIAGSVAIKGLMSMAIACGILTGVVYILGQLAKNDPEAMEAGVNKLIPIMAAIAVVCAVAGATNFQGLKGVVGLAVAITILLIPIHSLANMELGKGIQGIVAVIAIFAAIIVLIHQSKGVESISSLSGLVGTIVALSLVAWLVGQMDPLDAIIGFGLIIAMIAVISNVLKNVSKVNPKKMNTITKLFTVITVMVGIVAGAIIAMKMLDVDWKLPMAFIGGMALFVGLMGKYLPALAALAKSDFVAALKGLALMAIGIVILGAAFSIIAPMIATSIGYSIKLFFEQIEGVGDSIKKLVDGFKNFSESEIAQVKKKLEKTFDAISVVSGFGSIAWAVQQFTDQIFLLKTSMDMVFSNDSTIPDPRNSNFVKMVKYFSDEQLNLSQKTFGNFPKELFLLGVAFGSFDTMTRGINSGESGAIQLIQNLFGQADNIDKIIHLPLHELEAKLTTLGGAMGIYAEGANALTGAKTNMTGITDEEAVQEAVGILQAVCDTLNEDGGIKIPDNLPASTELGTFAAQLEALGLAMSGFSKGCKDMDTSTDKGMAALKYLVKLKEDLTPNNVGVTTVFSSNGINWFTLTAFGLEITALGTGLSNFAGSVKNANFDNGIIALRNLADINAQLKGSNVSNIKNWTEDENVNKTVLGNFGVQISALGKALGEFAAKVNYTNANGEIDETKVNNFKNAMDAVETLTKLSPSLGEDGGLWQYIVGHRKTYAQLAQEIPGLGDAMAEFSQKLNGLPTSTDPTNNSGFVYSEKIKSALGVLSYLVNMFGTDDESTPNYVKYNKDYFTHTVQDATKDYKTIGDDIAGLGEKLVRFSNIINGNDFDGITSRTGFDYSKKMRNALSVLDYMLNIQANNVLPEKKSWLHEVFEGHTLTLNEFGDDIAGMGAGLTKFSQNLNGLTENDGFNIELARDAVGLIDNIVNIATGLWEGSTKNRNTVSTTEYVNKLTKFIKDLNGTFFNGGNSAGKRLAEFAQQLSQAFAEVEGIDAHSIGIFRDLAEALSTFTDIGTNGADYLSVGVNIAEKISEGLSSNESIITTTVQGIILAIQEALSGEFVITPTISPVFDVNDIRFAKSELNNALNGKYGITPQANDSFVNTLLGKTMTVHVANPVSLEPVLSSISGLQSQIRTLAESISNIQIVLDSGVVAGGVSDQVDLNIGDNSWYDSRRNATPTWSNTTSTGGKR